MKIKNIAPPPFNSSWINEIWEGHVAWPHLQSLYIYIWGIPFIKHAFPIRFDPEEFLIKTS